MEHLRPAAPAKPPNHRRQSPLYSPLRPEWLPGDAAIRVHRRLLKLSSLCTPAIRLLIGLRPASLREALPDALKFILEFGQQDLAPFQRTCGASTFKHS